MMANAPKDLSTQDYRKIDRAHAWHPLFQHQLLDQSDLLVFESASGTTIVDADGNEYLDAYSALWNVNAPKDLSTQDYRKIDRAHAWHPLFQHQLLDQSDLLVFESASGTTIVNT